ncbi:MAG: hypothetical protein KGI94_15485 [Paracoccaceae bacterium]|nr:hypothetical protein [Paracoccaceae bacterium]
METKATVSQAQPMRLRRYGRRLVTRPAGVARRPAHVAVALLLTEFRRLAAAAKTPGLDLDEAEALEDAAACIAEDIMRLPGQSASVLAAKVLVVTQNGTRPLSGDLCPPLWAELRAAAGWPTD